MQGNVTGARFRMVIIHSRQAIGTLAWVNLQLAEVTLAVVLSKVPKQDTKSLRRKQGLHGDQHILYTRQDKMVLSQTPVSSKVSHVRS